MESKRVEPPTLNLEADVPVQSAQRTPNGREVDVSLVDLLGRIWNGRRTLGIVTAGFLLASLLFLLGSRSEFESRATLMPEKSTDGIGGGMNLGLLGQVSGLLGGAGASNLLRSGNTLPVELYPDVLQSTSVLLALLEHPVYVATRDTTVRLYTYLDTFLPFSAGDAFQTTLAKLPGRPGLQIFSTPPSIDTNIVRLNADQARILEELRGRLIARFDIRAGLLHVSATMPDPGVAAQTAQLAVDRLTTYVTEYRLRKLHQNLAFIEQRHGEARARFNSSLDELARFRDRNQHLTRDLARTEEQRLQAEYDLAFNVYNSLSTRLEEARIQVEEETPVFQIVEPVTVPLQKSHPSTLLTLFFGGLLGLMIGAGALVFAPYVRSFRNAFRRTTLPRTAAPAR